MNSQKQQAPLLPEDVSKLATLPLKARLVVEGFITGLHKSPYHGFSVEFAEHRQYMPGDEIRHIDWKIYGRTNRFYVKQYEEETNLKAMIALDASASMAYASEGHISKYEYGTYLAAALTVLMMKQQDAVGMSLYDNTVQTFMPPRAKMSYAGQILKTLSAYKPQNNTQSGEALGNLAERLHRRGLVAIISDCLDNVDSLVEAIKHFRHRNHEVIVFHIMDPREVDFEFDRDAVFVDSESGEELTTQPAQIKEAYKEQVASFSQRVKRECRQRNVDYMLITTDQPFDKALLGYLNKRQRIAG